MDRPQIVNRFMFYWFVFSITMQFVFAGLVLGAGWRPSAWMMVIFSQAIIIGVPCAVYLWTHRGSIKEILPLRRLGIKNTMLVVGMSVAIFPLGLIINAIMLSFFGNPLEATTEGLMAEGGLWLMLALITILPSIFEEVMLRGIVFAGYKRVKIFVTALVNGLFFGLIHQNFVQFSYAFLLGFFMCYFAYYTKSIWAPVLRRFVIKTVGVMVGYFATSLPSSSQSVGYYAHHTTPMQDIITLIAVFGIIALLFGGTFAVLFQIFKKHNLQRNQASGVVTDTYAEAVQRGENQPKVLTRGFWAFVAATLSWMTLIEITSRMV